MSGSTSAAPSASGWSSPTTGAVVATERRPDARTAPTQLVATVDRLVETLLDRAGADATVGVGLPGSITRDGVLTSSPHLPGVTNFDAAGALSRAARPASRSTNDASCAALAEWTLGAGRGVDDMIMITLGTGIGGGVIADGRLLLGAHGYLGEFGHMMIDPNGPSCPCGQRGLLGALRVGLGDRARGQAGRG